MRAFITTLITFAAASQLFVGCCTTPPPSAWEYRDTFIARGDSFDKWAKDGWIIVTAYYDSNNNNTHYFAKRLKKSR